MIPNGVLVINTVDYAIELANKEFMNILQATDHVMYSDLQDKAREFII